MTARTLGLGRWPGLNGDESWYGVNVQELLGGGTPFMQTGIGNPLNPFHSGPLLVVSTLFEPSTALLRVPEVLLGLLAVGLAYPLLSRTLGPRPALLATVLLAVSPTAIVYSRFGWDPSGTPLMTLLAVGLALANRPAASAAALAAAYLVHPTNLFVTPIVAAAWAPHAIAKYRSADAAARARVHRAAAAAVLVGVPAAIWMAARVAANPATTLPSVEMVMARAISPASWLARAAGFAGLLSGTSSVIHTAGPWPAGYVTAANALAVTIPTLALAAGFRAFRSHRFAPWLLAGSAAAFCGFHLVAMDAAMSPTLERYGLFMLVPLLLLCALAIDAAAANRAAGALAGAAALTTLMGVVIVGGYFVPLSLRGGDAAPTFRTGVVEPKHAALAFIDADSQDDGAVTVIAEDWWLYWSLRYFAGANGRIHVEPAPGASMPGGTHPPQAVLQPAQPPTRRYLVSFAGSALAGGYAGAAAVFTASDPAGRAILHVYAVP